MNLHIVEWANLLANGQLEIPLGERSLIMPGTAATGDPLLSNGKLGADIIRVPAGQGFLPHTHPGDHLLIVIGGQGTIVYDGRIYPTRAGQIYMIEGKVPHAVGAITDHVIIAVGSPHKAVDAPDRMSLVEYQAVTTDMSVLYCLICEREAELPIRLHDKKCPHCPCGEC